MLERSVPTRGVYANTDDPWLPVLDAHGRARPRGTDEGAKRGRADMPETFGKRQRKDVKDRKAAAAEQRRLARAQRRRGREAGRMEAGPPVATPEEVEQALYGVPDSVEQPEPAAEQ